MKAASASPRWKGPERPELRRGPGRACFSGRESVSAWEHSNSNPAEIGRRRARPRPPGPRMCTTRRPSTGFRLRPDAPDRFDAQSRHPREPLDAGPREHDGDLLRRRGVLGGAELDEAPLERQTNAGVGARRHGVLEVVRTAGAQVRGARTSARGGSGRSAPHRVNLNSAVWRESSSRLIRNSRQVPAQDRSVFHRNTYWSREAS